MLKKEIKLCRKLNSQFTAFTIKKEYLVVYHKSSIARSRQLTSKCFVDDTSANNTTQSKLLRSKDKA